MQDFELVYNVGINDVDSSNQFKPNRPRKNCLVQKKWKTMLRRCYAPSYQASNPLEEKRTVCEEWLTFSKYESWLFSQDFVDKVLTIKLINSDNTVYDPDNAIFVSAQINALILPSKKRVGLLPTGVKQSGKGRFVAEYKTSNFYKYIGIFDTQDQASTAYKNAKANHIASIAREQTDKRVKQALLIRALLIRNS